MKISLGSDHAGFEAKEAIEQWLIGQGLTCLDKGTHDTESCDYPDFAGEVGRSVSIGESEMGILVCGTGIGMSICANKIEKVRAALCHDEHTAQMSREHNDSNVLCLGARQNDQESLLRIVGKWLDTSFGGDRHARRVSKIGDLEQRL